MKMPAVEPPVGSAIVWKNGAGAAAGIAAATRFSFGWLVVGERPAYTWKELRLAMKEDEATAFIVIHPDSWNNDAFVFTLSNAMPVMDVTTRVIPSPEYINVKIGDTNGESEVLKDERATP